VDETAAGSGLPEEPIAEGRVAQVYPWGPDRVLKLGRSWVPEEWLKYEFDISRIVHAAGATIPEPFELIRVDGRTGILYAHVDGPTMLDRIAIAPLKAGAFGRMLGNLHAEMHATPGDAGLPDCAGRLHRKIESVEGAPDAYKQAALDFTANMPAGSALLHGDFHPGNVILGPEGPVIIDWPDASRGHPFADVARTVILISLGGLPPNPVLRILVNALRSVFRSAYLRQYFRHSALRRSELAPWLFPVLFARLSEGIESERESTRRWLSRLRPDLVL
jgi:aminoglycoside phosphotransferase (APT) family kinase protein